jgi:hypothetical protein
MKRITYTESSKNLTINCGVTRLSTIMGKVIISKVALKKAEDVQESFELKML